MKKIGLTGNMGSGKTTVAQVFMALDIPVYNSDFEAKKLYYDPEIVDRLVSFFSESIIGENNNIDTKKLGQIVFKSPEKLEFLNSVIHPKVTDNFEQWCKQQNSEYIIMESAIIFEADLVHLFDKIITVTTPEDIIIERVTKRDKISVEAIKSRLNNQWSQEKKAKLSDFVINNDGVADLLPQVLAVHDAILDS
ncbi:MAG: dephospho-CoA kinase [Lentimicrobiaceae bacterium]|nr:dephospho-CoA kinase [Lentimicrobiaceae bacterium]